MIQKEALRIRESLLRESRLTENEPYKGMSAVRYKKCPECFTYLSVETKKCSYCGRKLKKSFDKYGYSKKPLDWKSYFVFFFSFITVTAYMWWAFFRDN